MNAPAVNLGVFFPGGKFLLRAELTGCNPLAVGAKYYFGLDCADEVPCVAADLSASRVWAVETSCLAKDSARRSSKSDETYFSNSSLVIVSFFQSSFSMNMIHACL